MEIFADLNGAFESGNNATLVGSPDSGMKTVVERVVISKDFTTFPAFVSIVISKGIRNTFGTNRSAGCV